MPAKRVAKGAKPRKAAKTVTAPEKPAYARLHAIVSRDVAADMDAKRAELKRSGLFVSNSSLVEIAMIELLNRPNLPAILAAHKARARRG